MSETLLQIHIRTLTEATKQSREVGCSFSGLLRCAIKATTTSAATSSSSFPFSLLCFLFLLFLLLSFVRHLLVYLPSVVMFLFLSFFLSFSPPSSSRDPFHYNIQSFTPKNNAWMKKKETKKTNRLTKSWKSCQISCKGHLSKQPPYFSYDYCLTRSYYNTVRCCWAGESPKKLFETRM